MLSVVSKMDGFHIATMHDEPAFRRAPTHVWGCRRAARLKALEYLP